MSPNPLPLVSTIFRRRVFRKDVSARGPSFRGWRRFRKAPSVKTQEASSLLLLLFFLVQPSLGPFTVSFRFFPRPLTQVQSPRVTRRLSLRGSPALSPRRGQPEPWLRRRRSPYPGRPLQVSRAEQTREGGPTFLVGLAWLTGVRDGPEVGDLKVKLPRLPCGRGGVRRVGDSAVGWRGPPPCRP